MDWYQRRPWDFMSITPGRQPLQVQNSWRERDQRHALAWLQQQAQQVWSSSLTRVDEDASSTVVEIDTEARRAALRALEECRASGGSGSYLPQQFCWTFRCPDIGCGWAEMADDYGGHCPRCFAVNRTTVPLKFPTFMNKVGEEPYDNYPSNWFYFCHVCLKCTWKSNCCSPNSKCVDVRALKRRRPRFN